MMKIIRLALPLLLVTAVVATIRPVRGQSSQFIIQNADAVRDLSLNTPSANLQDVIDQIAARIAMEFADADRQLTLNVVPSALDALLATIEPRIIAQFADANRYARLTPVPAQLNTLLGQILARAVFQFADANRHIALAYPTTLIGDTTPPHVSQIAVAALSGDSAVITWTTNEFASSTVQCGTSSGAYTMTFSDPLYVTQHAVTLTGLAVGTTYYCRCSSTDLSGNMTRSQEFSFEQTEETSIYLPLVIRM